MDKDFLAFILLTEDEKTITFLQIEDKFFISYLEQFNISPLNQVVEMNYDSRKKIAHVKTSRGVSNLNLVGQELMTEFVKRFFERNNNKKTSSKFRLLPSNHRIAEIRFSYRKEFTGGKYLLVDNVSLRKIDNAYTSLKTGKGFLSAIGFKIDTYEIANESKSGKKFKDIAKEYANSFQQDVENISNYYFKHL